MNTEEINQLIWSLKYFEDLFGGILGLWDTEPVDLEIEPGSKPSGP